MAQEDFLKRQVEGISKVLGKVFLNSDGTAEEDLLEEEDVEGDLLSRQDELDAMIQAGSLNDAENILFSYLEDDERTEQNIADNQELVNWFYGRLEELSDEELEENDFTREELQEGRQDALASLEG